MEFVGRFFEPPESHFFLFGPRGTGKSTFLHQRFPKALFVDLLDPETCRNLQARPERLRELVEGDPSKRVVVIDEVQKVPQLLSAVHQLIEERKDRRFILTASSARKLKRRGVNLLAGRAVLRTLHPFRGCRKRSKRSKRSKGSKRPRSSQEALLAA
ncbi:MAG: AAA family ATPase [Acidobacteriota bacterium]